AASILVPWQPRIACAEQTPKNICFDDIGCTFPGPGQKPFTREALMGLGCQPLAALRGRSVYEYGVCPEHPFFRRLLQLNCSNSHAANEKAMNEIPSTGWGPIYLINAIEQIKRCVLRD